MKPVTKKLVPVVGILIAAASALGASLGQALTPGAQISGEWTINLHSFFAILSAVSPLLFFGGVWTNRIIKGQQALTLSIEKILERMEIGDRKFEADAMAIRELQIHFDTHVTTAHGHPAVFPHVSRPRGADATARGIEVAPRTGTGV